MSQLEQLKSVYQDTKNLRKLVDSEDWPELESALTQRHTQLESIFESPIPDNIKDECATLISQIRDEDNLLQKLIATNKKTTTDAILDVRQKHRVAKAYRQNDG